MGKSTIVISLSVPPELDKQLTENSHSRGYNNRSRLARELIEDFGFLSAESHLMLKRAAERRGVQVSELVEYLVDRFPIEDQTVKPIVLKIPIEVVRDRCLLESWLHQKVNALVNHLHPLS